jgi:hypothetical protein
VRYLPFDGFHSTAVRDLLFREAEAEIVLCVDSHIVLRPGALRALLDHFETHPRSLDIVQGPLLGDDLRDTYGTHFDPVWDAGMYGKWGVDDRIHAADGEPFEIPMNGLGVFACRREAWPGINPRFRGFGGEEGYLHEKFRRQGGRALCLPALAWAHRFERPSGVPYRALWQDRIRNYLIGWAEVGWDVGEVEAHFRSHLTAAEAAAMIPGAKRQIANPLMFFDAVMRLDGAGDPYRREAGLRSLEALDVAWRIERVAADAPEDPVRATVLAYRSVIEASRLRGYASVLAIGDVVTFVDGALETLGEAVEQLTERSWDLLFLDAPDAPEAPEGPQAASSARGAPCALAIGSTAFDRLLADLPGAADGPEMEDFLSLHGDFEHYLRACVEEGVYDAITVSEPVIQSPEPVDAAVVESAPARIAGEPVGSEVVLDIRAFGGSVRLIDTTALGIADRVAMLMPPDTIATSGEHPEIVLVATGGEQDQVTITGHGYDPVGPVCSQEAVMWLRAAIDAGIACTATDALFIHAGVVGWRGRAIVLPGRSGAGKSSLTMALVDAGATYYSDDLAPIDASGRVHAYAKAPSLKGAVPATRQVQPPGGGSVLPPLPIALIVATSFVPGARWAPLTQRGAIGVLPLLSNAVIATAKPQAAVAVAATIGASSITLSGPRAEASEVAQLILATLDAVLDDRGLHAHLAAG